MPYWGTRLAVAELSRATTQVAITLATAMGHRTAEHGAPSFRTWAFDSMCAALSGCCPVLPLSLNDVDDHEQKRGTPSKLIREFIKDHQRSNAALKNLPEYNVELVLVPLDGAHALREGQSGALSLIGAACEGSFVGKHGKDDEGQPSKDHGGQPIAECYLAIVVGNAALTSQPPLLPAVRHAADVWKWLEDEQVLQDLVAYVEPKIHMPVIATIQTPSMYLGPHVSLNGCMVRLLSGSTVGGALAALRNKVSAAICICWRPQVKLIALAARALQGSLYCVPLKKTRKKKTEPFGYRVVPRSAWRRETDFVSGDNGILVSSSISEVCFQDRVRFIGGGRASVNTLVVSLASRSLRDTTQELDLTCAKFYRPGGHHSAAAEELYRFRRDELGDQGDDEARGPSGE